MKKIIQKTVCLFLMVMLLTQTAFSQTEEEKKEMRELIGRLKTAEGKKELVVIKTTEIAQKEEKYNNDFISLREETKYHLDHPVPWDSVINVINEEGIIINKIFKQKPPERIAYEKKTEVLQIKWDTLQKRDSIIKKEKKDIDDIDSVINQAKRMIHLRANYFITIKKYFPHGNCREAPGPDASAENLILYWDCFFDGSNPNPLPPYVKPNWKAERNEIPAKPGERPWSPEQKKKMQTEGIVVPPPEIQKDKPGISDRLQNYMNDLRKPKVKNTTTPATVRG